jgi:hypothetical protein
MPGAHQVIAACSHETKSTVTTSTVVGLQVTFPSRYDNPITYSTFHGLSITCHRPLTNMGQALKDHIKGLSRDIELVQACRHKVRRFISSRPICFTVERGTFRYFENRRSLHMASCTTLKRSYSCCLCHSSYYELPTLTLYLTRNFSSSMNCSAVNI